MKKYKTLDEHIDMVIEEAIFNYFFEKKQIVTPKNKIGSAGLSIPYNDRNSLMEGYYSTFPIEKVINYISNRYNLTTNKYNVSLDRYNGLLRKENGDNNEELIAVFLPNNRYDKEKFCSDMSMCGYYLSHIQPYFNFDTLYFEKRHQDKISDIAEKYEYIYHVSPLKYEKKILINGLIPKTLSKLGFHPERIYFTTNVNYCEAIAYELQQVAIEKYNKETDVNKKKKLEFDAKNKEYVVFRVKTANIQDVNFFFDPNMQEAIYTNENIKPDFIEIVGDIDL